MLFRTVLVLFIAVSACVSNSQTQCDSESLQLQEFDIRLTRHQPQNRLGLILIMPPTGGSNFLDRQYAELLCENRFEAIIVEGWRGLGDKSLDLSIHKQLLGRGQQVIQAVLNEFEQPFIGILGTSVGALHGMTAFGKDQRIQAAFLIAGGGPIHKVIARSDEETLKMYRKKRMQKFGYSSVEEYEKALSSAIPKELDALTYAETIAEKPLALVVSDDDQTVSTQFQLNWEQAFEPDETYRFESSHFWTIVKTWWFHEEKIKNFFLKASELKSSSQL